MGRDGFQPDRSWTNETSKAIKQSMPSVKGNLKLADKKSRRKTKVLLEDLVHAFSDGYDEDADCLLEA